MFQSTLRTPAASHGSVITWRDTSVPVARCFSKSIERSDLELRTIRDDRPYFDGCAIFKARVAFGNVYRLFKTVCDNEPVTSNRFLRFRKGPVRYSVFGSHNFAPPSELISRFDLSLVSQAIVPGGEFGRHFPDLCGRKNRIPSGTA